MEKYNNFFRKSPKNGKPVIGRKVTRLTVAKDGSTRSEILRTEIRNPKSGEWQFSSGQKPARTSKLGEK